MIRLLRAAARVLANVADRPMRTDVPMTYGRICPGPGCSRSLDFNCRELAFENGLQWVRCAWCGIRSTWTWDDEGPILVAHQVARDAA